VGLRMVVVVMWVGGWVGGGGGAGAGWGGGGEGACARLRNRLCFELRLPCTPLHITNFCLAGIEDDPGHNSCHRSWSTSGSSMQQRQGRAMTRRPPSASSWAPLCPPSAA
jgi:hypothetical protein